MISRLIKYWLVVVCILGATSAQALRQGELTPESSFEAVGNVLRILGKGYCSGTLIAHQTVLTAAHCVCSSRENCEERAKFRLRRVRSVNAPTGDRQDVNIKGDVYVHPDYERSQDGRYEWLGHDYAIIELDEPVYRRAIGIDPIPVLPHFIPHEGDRVTLVGYGNYGHDCSLWDNGKKRLFHTVVSSVTIGRMHLPNAAVCSGDSGGPAIFSGSFLSAIGSDLEYSSPHVIGVASENSHHIPVYIGYAWIKRFLEPEAIIVDNLNVLSGRDYRVVDNALSEDMAPYIDRDYQLSEVPDQFKGATLIQTANNDKALSKMSDVLSFALNKPAYVYVAHDDRVARPSWLRKHFRDTGMTLKTTDKSSRGFSIFKRFYGGRDDTISVTLGANADKAAKGSMYIVFVDDQSHLLGTLTTTSNRHYEVIPYGLEETTTAGLCPGCIGAKSHADRDYWFAEVPPRLRGRTYIRTPNDDKLRDERSGAITFELTRSATVFVAWDTRLAMPPWLKDHFRAWGGRLEDNKGVKYSLMGKRFPAGKVDLGGNCAEAKSTDACWRSNHYVVIIDDMGDYDQTVFDF